MNADETSFIAYGYTSSKENWLNSVEKVLRNAKIWFWNNVFELNVDKAQTICFSNAELYEKEYVKLLGIKIDESLNWSLHIDGLCEKLSSAIFVLRRHKEVVHNKTFLTYHSLFHSHLSYGYHYEVISLMQIEHSNFKNNELRNIINVSLRDHPYLKNIKLCPFQHCS